MIAISSAHRRESLAATDFAINELKRTVPIWKKVESPFEGLIILLIGDV